VEPPRKNLVTDTMVKGPEIVVLELVGHVFGSVI
jgi:hypothetical protein